MYLRQILLRVHHLIYLHLQANKEAVTTLAILICIVLQPWRKVDLPWIGIARRSEVLRLIRSCELSSTSSRIRIYKNKGNFVSCCIHTSYLPAKKSLLLRLRVRACAQKKNKNRKNNSCTDFQERAHFLHCLAWVRWDRRLCYTE